MNMTQGLVVAPPSHSLHQERWTVLLADLSNFTELTHDELMGSITNIKNVAMIEMLDQTLSIRQTR